MERQERQREMALSFFSFCVVAVWDPRLSLSPFLLFPFRKDPSSFGGREPLHCLFHGTFLPYFSSSSFSSDVVVVVVVTVDFSFWAASLPLPYLIKMVTAVISCCERRDATRRYGRLFPFSFFLFFSHEFASSRHFAGPAWPGLAFSLFLYYGRCERENVNGARLSLWTSRVSSESTHVERNSRT